MRKLISPKSLFHARCLQVFILLIASACREKDVSKNSDPPSETAKSSRTKAGTINSVSEWYAFSVFHPTSTLSEESFVFPQQQSSNTALNEKAIHLDDEAINDLILVLGAKSLIPILRETFGNQARSSDDSDDNSWFTTHPSDLFTPSELNALCHYQKASELEGVENYCWKPRLTQEYLVALSNFAADACAKLVERESKNQSLSSNKILRSLVFNSDNLRYFAIHYLRMQKHDVSEEWLNKIESDAEKFVREELKLETPTSSDTVKVYSIEKAIFSCRAALSSKEFYSR